MPLEFGAADFRVNTSLLSELSSEKLLDSSRTTSESSHENHQNQNRFKAFILSINEWILDKICLSLGSYPLRTLSAIMILLIPLHSYYFFYPLNIESDVRRGFAERNGRSAAEFKRFADYYDLPFDGLEIWVVLMTPKRSLGKDTIHINQHLLDELVRLDDFIRDFQTTFQNHFTHFNETSSHENLNQLLQYFQQIYPLIGLVPGVDISYPTANIFGHKLHLSTHFFMVNQGIDTRNQTSELETAQYVALWYMSRAANYTQKKKLEAIELGLFKLFLHDNFSEAFSLEMFGDQVANAEMLRGTLISLGLFIGGGLLMIGFMFYMFRHLTWKSRLWMTFGAMLSPLLATISTFSLLGWLSVRINSMMCITPFLVLGIGVDDAFLLLHQWRRARVEGILKPRVGLRSVLSHVGPSMGVTSLTNTLAFGIGITNPSPQMSTFCLGTMLAVLLDFIYEFAIFTPIMVTFYEERKDFGGDMEKKNHGLFTWKSLVSFLSSLPGRLFVVLVCILMYSTAGIGLSGMVPSFEPAKTFPADSELIHSLRSFEFIQSEYWPTNFISLKAPKTWQDMVKWEEMVKRSYKGATQRFQNRVINQFRSMHCQHFSKNKKLLGEKLSSITDRKVSVMASGMTDWNRRAQLVKETREIVDEYPQFDTSLFDYDSTIYDIIISVKSELIQAVAITFSCMCLISAISIPEFLGATLASLSMLSTSACMLGFLAIWGCGLDPIVMINVLMAIGFSVDFSAHICYYYHKTRLLEIRETKEERLSRILEAVGRPMIEAGLSTIICMLPLFFVNIYVITSFAKTVCLVASIGLFHGLVIIPLILTFVPSK